MSVVALSSRVPEERPKTFLLEVAVVRECLNNAFATHGLHGNAICQTMPERSGERLCGITRTPGLFRML
jgi:hypothetical protein